MIDHDSFNAAIGEINPQHDAINSVVGSFGPTEGVALVDDLLRAFEIDPQAFRDLGESHLARMLEEGIPLAAAKQRVEDLLLGVVIGVGGARYQGVDFGDV